MWFYTADLSLPQDSKLPAGRNDTGGNTLAFPETP